MPEPTTAPVTAEDLRERIEASVGPAMRLGLQDAELFDEPGAQRIEEWITHITDQVLAALAWQSARGRAKAYGESMTRLSGAWGSTEAEVERLRAELAEASDALCAVGKAALVVAPTLAKPYPDAPKTSPWEQFMERPARDAYNLGTRIRRELKEARDAR